jgi:hypothetical protein
MMKIINLPFAGFYYSELDAMIDHYVEMEAYNAYESNDALSEETYHQLIWDACDFKEMHLSLAKAYIDELNAYVESNTGLNVNFKFESLVSPREYNFTTDRLFAYVSEEVIKILYDHTSLMTLSQVIKERHSSYDGFISHYSNDLEDWLENPLEEWDYNELGTLFIAYLQDNVDPDWERHVHDALSERSYGILQEHLDWPTYDQATRNAIQNLN